MLPDLRSLERVAIDTETRDEGLATERGSSWPWGAGFIAGVSAAWRAEGGIKSIYIPFRHPDSDNVDRELVKRWLVDLFASGTQIVFQNSVYDLGWLQADLGVAPPAAERIDELGAVSTLVDENRYAYSLDSLCKWRGLPGKDKSALREAAIALGMPKRGKHKPQKYIWQMPASVVAPYAEADAVATLALFDSLNPVLDQENARAAYRLECDLLPMVLAMRRRGIRIDVNAAEQARDLLLGKRDAVLGALSEKLGTTVSMAEINRNSWRASTFDTHKIDYPRTEKGAPSFTADWMAKHKHWLPRLIVQADRLNKFAVDFLETYILGHVVNGRVHAEIHPHRSDEGGTITMERHGHLFPTPDLVEQWVLG
jgi:DNA polymerase I-like protein with 3'-5' exonuclease and polymerase domains